MSRLTALINDEYLIMAKDREKVIDKLGKYEDLGEPEELQRKGECKNIYDVWANPTINLAARLEKQSEELVKISGYSVEDLIDKFKQGYKLVLTNMKPPKGERECEPTT